METLHHASWSKHIVNLESLVHVTHSELESKIRTFYLSL
jgi:hypothetical protein